MKSNVSELKMPEMKKVRGGGTGYLVAAMFGGYALSIVGTAAIKQGAKEANKCC